MTIVSSLCRLIAATLLLSAIGSAFAFERTALREVGLSETPAEVRQTIGLIRRGGPFPYSRDGVGFANREGRLPKRERGYYQEYTVKTPGAKDRGARRIIAGKGGELYYTQDHYRSFMRIRD